MPNYEHKYDVVASIYDQYVNSNFDIDFWIKECKKEKEVLELAAGTGRITVPLAKAGIRVTALDISPKLLGQLKKKVREGRLEVKIIKADMRNFKLGAKYSLVILPFHSIQELLRPADQFATFKQVANHLQAGGRFIVPIRNPIGLLASSGRMRLSGKFVDKNSGHRVLFYSKRTIKGPISTNEQVYKEYDGKKEISEHKFINRSYVFEKDEFEGIIKKSGFRIRHIWGGYDYRPFRKSSKFLIYDLVR
jgi:ubiquinone/menaquinone biosynthesis C-methylase UbiE